MHQRLLIQRFIFCVLCLCPLGLSPGTVCGEGVENNQGIASSVDQDSKESTGRSLVLRRDHAASDARKAVSPKQVKLDQSTGAFHLFWPMFIVLGLVGFCVFAVRKWMPQASRFGDKSAIKVLARHYLSSKQSLCLVRLGRRAVLIGLTPDHVSTLMDITDADELAELTATVERNRPRSFTNMFGKFSSEPFNDETDTVGDKERFEEGLMVSDRNLVRTGERVRELVNRVRAISAGSRASTESRQQLVKRS